ncbi:MAG: family 43 glycosylhydrolase [Bacteroidales bacterium]|nr:family 43 glycosylhydrolase [Bacteroidales bacterium]
MNTLKHMGIACLFFLSSLLVGCSEAGFSKIQNDVFWDTRDGHPIYSQGGGVFRFTDPDTGNERYYWYGVHYKEAEKYREDRSKTYDRCTFEAVSCYSSDDLVHWTKEADVLTKEEASVGAFPGWMGRMGVAYVKESGLYALFVQRNAHVFIAVSESPKGPFTFHQQRDMTDLIGFTGTGDQTVFTDETSGKSYLVYSKPHGRNRIYVSEIGMLDGKVDLLDCTQIYAGDGREGNCMFEHNGKYYMYASLLYGWDSSFAYYLVSDDVRGPYEPLNKMRITAGCEDDFAHITQTGFFVKVKGSKQETVLYCGDRWADFAGNGLGYNQWVPLSFEGDQPYFNSLNAWELNAKTGEWRVSKDNNYVKNSSFEADRNRIPSAFKPVQDHLTGWVTEVVKGSPVQVGDSLSPVLNHFNSKEDRSLVVGEKSLCITDRVDFERKVYQQIKSSPYVTLEDGTYTLSAMLRQDTDFDILQLFAVSGSEIKTLDVDVRGQGWTRVCLDKVKVKGGSIQIGIHAVGSANAFCLMDDVVLIINK